MKKLAYILLRMLIGLPVFTLLFVGVVGVLVLLCLVITNISAFLWAVLAILVLLCSYFVGDEVIRELGVRFGWR